MKEEHIKYYFRDLQGQKLTGDAMKTAMNNLIKLNAGVFASYDYKIKETPNGAEVYIVLATEAKDGMARIDLTGDQRGSRGIGGSIQSANMWHTGKPAGLKLDVRNTVMSDGTETFSWGGEIKAPLAFIEGMGNRLSAFASFRQEDIAKPEGNTDSTKSGLRNTFSTGAEFQISENWASRTTFNYKRQRYEGEGLQEILSVQEGFDFNYTTVDTMNNPISPVGGFRIMPSVEYGGVVRGGGGDFYKAQMTVFEYFALLPRATSNKLTVSLTQTAGMGSGLEQDEMFRLAENKNIFGEYYLKARGELGYMLITTRFLDIQPMAFGEAISAFRRGDSPFAGINSMYRYGLGVNFNAKVLGTTIPGTLEYDFNEKRASVGIRVLTF